MTTISQPEEIVKMISSFSNQLVAPLLGSQHDNKVIDELLAKLRKKKITLMLLVD